MAGELLCCKCKGSADYWLVSVHTGAWGYYCTDCLVGQVAPWEGPPAELEPHEGEFPCEDDPPF